MQAQPAFAAAFELLPSAWRLLTGRRAPGAISDVGDLRSLGDLSWLTGLLLLGTDCSPALSPPWAACLQQVRLQRLTTYMKCVLVLAILHRMRGDIRWPVWRLLL